MPYLTIFSAPKPFTNPHIATIQRNALKSWLHLGKEVEVLLVGEEEGITEVARELGVRHLPDVARNSRGTPLVSSIFSLARQVSTSPLLAYVNADIILRSDFIQSVHQVDAQVKNFLVVGQRWDLELNQELEFLPNWEFDLLAKAKMQGCKNTTGIDFFIFPRHQYSKIPDFAIGRAGWDNWMIYHAHQQSWLVIDASASIAVIHQNHDYSHLPEGRPHYDIEESRLNIALAGEEASLYTILDANRLLVNGRIRFRPINFLRTIRWLELKLMPLDRKKHKIRWQMVRRLRRIRRSINRSKT
ncbi:MAG: hypothetical protein AB1345_00130 [Chloroflexota bacterium]